MGQVPVENSNATPAVAPNLTANQILLIGNGRLAKSLLQTGVDSHWFRGSGHSLADHLQSFRPTHVWLAISDGALKNFVQENAVCLSETADVRSPRLVHFAGGLPTFSVAGLTVHAVHPLMTFSDSNIDSTKPPAFSKAPLIVDSDSPSLEILMPGFSNPVHRIDPKQRAYYHALCAIAGNFSVLLWEAVARRFESDLGLSAEALDAYRNQIFENLSKPSVTELRPISPLSRKTVLTGPLSRGDSATLAAHRAALFERAEIPLLKIYDSFADLYRTDRERTRREKELK